MNQNKRILLVGSDPELTDSVTRRLEMAGFIVTNTVDHGVAIDLAGSSDYAALLIGGELSQAERLYITTQARRNNPSTVVVVVHSLESVLTQLRQAGAAV